jgi:hypothetical protein
LVQLQKARDFPLYPYALAVQEIAEIPEIHDHVIQLVQGDTSDLLNERIYVRDNLGSVFRFVTDMGGILTDGLAKCFFNLRSWYDVRIL